MVDLVVYVGEDVVMRLEGSGLGWSVRGRAMVLMRGLIEAALRGHEGADGRVRLGEESDARPSRGFTMA